MLYQGVSWCILLYILSSCISGNLYIKHILILTVICCWLSSSLRAISRFKCHDVDGGAMTWHSEEQVWLGKEGHDGSAVSHSLHREDEGDLNDMNSNTESQNGAFLNLHHT